MKLPRTYRIINAVCFNLILTVYGPPKMRVCDKWFACSEKDKEFSVVVECS